MITVASYGHGGSSARVRVHDWIRHLGLSVTAEYDYIGTSENSFSTLASRLPDVARAERTLRRLGGRRIPGTLLMSREASPLSNGSLEAALLKAADFSVYDFDDAIYHNAAPFPYSLYPKGQLWKRSVGAADRLIAGNEILAEHASSYHGDVVMIPSCVEPGDYVQKADYTPRETTTVVWLGSPATERFLAAIAAPLKEAAQQTPLRVRVISRGEQSLGAIDPLVDRIPWGASTFGAALADADVGIMPLPDTEFTRGKCAYKLLQYGAAGLPVVGSPVGTNRLVLDRMGGIAASTPEEWVEGVMAVAHASESERAARGQQAKDAVKNHYSFAAWASTWNTALGLNSSS